MIWYEGYPRDNGSTDFCDSARLMGLIYTMKFSSGFSVKSYFNKHGSLVRCPVSDIDGDKCFDSATFSRDQFIPLIAGYCMLGDRFMADRMYLWLKARNWILPNGDILSPSQIAHIKTCAGVKTSFFERAWIYLDILFSAYVQPMAEPNQLICMLVVAEKVPLWKKLNKNWRDAILEYWCEGAGHWRNEKELAENIIRKLEGEL